METSSKIILFVNGKKVVVQTGGENDVEPDLSLVAFLRENLGLVGCKLSCGMGGCGACAVMVSSYDKQTKKIKHFPINSCLTPLSAVDGMAVTTVEGIGSTKTRLHPVQERIAKAHGSQCGFCTPGMVMSMYTLLRDTVSPSLKEIETAIEGNLCRCTGYRPIYEGFKTFSKEFCCQGSNADDAGCCKNSYGNKKYSGLFNPGDFTPYDSTQEPIFPPELMLSDGTNPRYLRLESDQVAWFRPSTLQQALELKKKYPAAKCVSGMNGAGIGKTATRDNPVTVISLSEIPELNVVQCSEDGVTFGASVSLATVQSSLRDLSESLSEPNNKSCNVFLHMLSCYGNKQVRHMFSVSSNILHAIPPSDFNVVLVTLGAKLNVISTEGQERIILCDDKFLLATGKNTMANNELLVSVHIPLTRHQHEYVYFYRQARRRRTDVCIVNAAMRVRLEQVNDLYKVKDCCIAYGNVGPSTVMARKTMEALQGRVWDESIVPYAFDNLAKDVVIPDDSYQAEYKKSLVQSFFFKFYLDVAHRGQKKQSERETYSTYKSHQTFEDVAVPEDSVDVLGLPVSHLAASQQATGEAKYCNDIPPRKGELYVARVLSQRTHAKILSVDASQALDLPGVHTFLCAADVPGTNDVGLIPEEELFASDEVCYAGQAIGAIVAETKDIAQRAAKMVNITYEDLPAVHTIQEAIGAESFFDQTLSITNGDVNEGFSKSNHVIEGELYAGGQEHFYLETQTSLAFPGEDGEMELYCSTQNPTFMQAAVAKVLGVPFNRVVVRTKRIGGGFGGKLTNSAPVAAAVALAAQRTGRAVRCSLDQEEDMKTTGKREEYLMKYKAFQGRPKEDFHKKPRSRILGFTTEGKIQALKATYFGNSGSALDLSIAVLEKCLLNAENCYLIPNVEITAQMCRTNLPPNTAMRSLSSVQAIMFIESLISDVAKTCGISERKVRELNFYKEGELTPFNQKLTNCTLHRVWEKLIQECDFETRRAEIEAFNSENRWKKRGFAIVPGKYGMAIVFAALCQGAALVLVYTDGTVLVAHGGVEMGQGLYTKIAQIAARALGISISKVFIRETATNTIPNTSPSGASYTLDLNGMAVKIACEEIIKRLTPYKNKNPDGSWNDWVQAAYFDRVSLSATGFYKTPGVGYNWETNTGNPFAYFTYGACYCEVEIDCLTGDHKVLRSDIVMDIGKSLNPAIDIGQIEGAFVQGLGMFTIEELRYSRDGQLITNSRRNYKVPTLGDIPTEFNVHILKNSRNDVAVHSSKGVGEPAIVLSSAVFLAIKDAVASARHEIGLEKMFRFDSPATCERIRMTCGDQLKNQIPAE